MQIYTNSRAQSKQQIFGMLVKRIHLSPLHMHVRLDTNQGYDLTFSFIKTFLQNHSLEFRMKEFRVCLAEEQSKEGECEDSNLIQWHNGETSSDNLDELLSLERSAA